MNLKGFVDVKVKVKGVKAADKRKIRGCDEGREWVFCIPLKGEMEAREKVKKKKKE